MVPTEPAHPLQRSRPSLCCECLFRAQRFPCPDWPEMPFRLLNPAAAQCESAVVVRRRSFVSTALQRFGDTAVAQCEGITRAGRPYKYEG